MRSFSPEPTATVDYTVAVGSGLNECESANASAGSGRYLFEVNHEANHA
jgi:hypothetical protein